MKKCLPIALLLGALYLSLLSVTFAAYTITIDNLEQGGVGAKVFAFEVSESSGEIQLSPGEEQEIRFTLKNYTDHGTAAMNLATHIDIVIPTAQGLKATLSLNGDNKCSVQDGGTISCSGSVLPTGQKTDHVYTLTLSLSETNDVSFTQSISISASAFPGS